MKKILLILSLFLTFWGYSSPIEDIKWKDVFPDDVWSLQYSPGLDDVLNYAEICLYKYQSDKAAEIYSYVLETVSEKELKEFRYDNCSGMFIANAGLCFSAGYAREEKKKNMLTNDIYYLSGKKAYDIVMNNSAGCQNINRLEQLLWALAEIAPKNNRKYMEHALELSNTRTVEKITKRVKEAWLIFVRGGASEAAFHFDEIMKVNPRIHPSEYTKAGLVFLELEDYRKTLKYWLYGMRLMDLRFFHGCTQDSIREIRRILPILTTDEIKELIEIIKRITARHPALAKNVSDIAAWMNLANDEQIQFELKLRELESSQSPEYKIMLREALKKYNHPVYAEKLGDYKLSAEMQCKRIDKCSAYFRLRYYMKRFEHIKDKVDSEALKKYRDVLAFKVRAFKPETDINKWYPELIEEMKQKIKELDAAHPEWQQKTKSNLK